MGIDERVIHRTLTWDFSVISMGAAKKNF